MVKKINPFNIKLNGFFNLIMRFEINDLLYLANQYLPDLK